MFFQMKLFSKDKNSLKKISQFIFDLKLINLVVNCSPKKRIKKVVTVLKSPHVNKTAQEQFEFRIFSKKLLIGTPRPALFLYTLKKVKNISFPGIYVKITGVTKKRKDLPFLTPSNASNLNFFSSIRKKAFYSKYIQSVDSYGEYYTTSKQKHL